jgi:hypothetical protein
MPKKKFTQAFRIGTLTVTFSCDDPTLCPNQTVGCEVNSLCKMNSCGDCTIGDTCGPASCNESVAPPLPKDTLKGFPQLAEIAASMMWLTNEGSVKTGLDAFREKLDRPKSRR